MSSQVTELIISEPLSLPILIPITVVDSIESPHGKYPPKLGNVVLLSYKSAEELLQNLLNTTLRNDPTFKLGILALQTQRNPGSIDPNTDSDVLIDQLIGDITLTNNVMSVIVMKENAVKTYVKGQKARRRDIIKFSNDVAVRVGTSRKVDYVAPIWMALESTATMQIYLGEV